MRRSPAWREARLLRHQPRLRPSQPRRCGDQQGSPRPAGRHPIPSQPLCPLAGAADPPGRADGPRLGRRRGQSAGRQHRDRWPGDAAAGRAGACRGHGPAGRGGAVAAGREYRRLALRRPASSPGWRRSRAGIPGFLLANFTWADIYAPYARAAGGDANAWSPTCDRPIARPRWSSAPSQRCGWPGCPGRSNVGMVANPGRDRRKELHRILGLSSKEKLVYFYIGRYGQTRPRLGAAGEVRRQRESTSSAITPRRSAASRTCTSCPPRNGTAAT